MKKVGIKRRFFLAVGLFFLSVVSASAATVTISSSTNWSAITTGSGTGGVPNASDDIMINSGAVLTVNVSSAACNSITIATASVVNGVTISGTNSLAVTGAIVINDSTAASTFNVGTGTMSAASVSIAGNTAASALTVSTGTINISGNISFSGTAAQAKLTFTGAGILNIGGNLSAGGTFTKSTGTVNFNGTSAQTFAGYNYYTVKSNNAAGITPLAAPTITTLTIADINSTAVFNDGGFAIATATTLNLNSGTYTCTAATFPWGTLPANTGTVTYGLGGTQTVKAFTTYNNLIISGSGNKTLAGNITVNGNLTVSGGTLIDAAYTITGTTTGTFAVNAGASFTSTNTTAPFPTNMLLSISNTSTISLNAGTYTIPTLSFGNLTLGATNHTLSGSTTISSNLVISAGGTLTDAGYTLTVNGNITNGGTHSGAGEILLSGGSATHALSGATASWGNIELNDPNGATFIGSGTSTVGNIIVTTGTLTLNAFTTALAVSGTTNITGTLTINSVTGTRTFTGLVTVNSVGTWNNSINATDVFQGGITNNGTFTGGTGTQTFNTNSQNLAGSNALNFGGAVTITGAITVTNQNTSTITISGVLNGSVAGSTWINGDATHVAYLSYKSATAPMVTGVLTATASGNTVDYSLNNTQAVAGTSYYNLTVSGGAGTKTANNNVTINGALSTVSGNIFALSTRILSGTPTSISNAGTITTSNTSATPIPSGQTWGGTVQFVVGAQSVVSGTYNNLTLTTGTNTAKGNITVNGTLTVTAGTFALSTYTLSGTPTSISNAGIITTSNTSSTPLPSTNWGSTGTVTYAVTTGTQTVVGGTYFNLTLSATSGTNTASGSITVGGALTFSGAGTLSTAYDVNLNGTATGATGIITATAGTATYAGTAVNVFKGTYNNLTFTSTSATNTAYGAITVNGTLTTAAGGTFNMNTFALALGGSAIVSNAGTIKTLCPTATSAVPIPTGLTWGGTIQYAATAGAQTIVAGTYNNLTLSNTSGINTAGGNVIVNGTLTTTSGGTFDLTTNILSGTLTTIANSGTIKTSCPTATSAIPIPSGLTWGGTIQYYATTGVQTIVAGTYNNLTLSNTSGINTAGGNITVNGTLTTTANGTFNLATNTLGGTPTTLTNNGTIQTSNTSSTPFPTGLTWGGTGTVQYALTGGGQTVVAGTYYKLTLSNTSGTNVAGGVITVSNVFSFAGAGTFSTGYNLNINSTITAGGTVNATSGTTTYASATGSNVFKGNYTNLSFTGSSVTYTANGAINVNGSLSTSTSSTIFYMNTFVLGGTIISISNTGTVKTSCLTATSTVPIPPGLIWNGTIQYAAATGVQTIVAGTYNNLTLSNTSGINTAGGIITVGGALSLTGAGTFTTANNLFINGTTAIGGTLNGTGSSIVNYGGAAQNVFKGTYTNLTLSGTGIKTTTTTVTINGVLSLEGDNTLSVSTLPTYGGSATLQYKGSASQTTGAEFATFAGSGGVIINNTNGVTLAANCTVNNTLTLTNGVLNTNGYTITANTDSRGTGWVNGNLALNVATGSSTENYYIGDASYYTPVALVFTGVSTAGKVKVSTTGSHYNTTLLNTSGINYSLALNRYYTITNVSEAGGTYSPTFNFQTTDITPADKYSHTADPTKFVVKEYTGSSWTSPTTSSALSTSTTATGISTFGDFAIGQAQSLDHFDLLLNASEANNQAFTGTNTVTACDASDNTYALFNTSGTFTLTCDLPGSLSGGGTSFSNTNFTSGVANLTSLGVTYYNPSWTAPETRTFTLTTTLAVPAINTQQILIDQGKIMLASPSPSTPTAGSAFTVSATSSTSIGATPAVFSISIMNNGVAIGTGNVSISNGTTGSATITCNTAANNVSLQATYVSGPQLSVVYPSTNSFNINPAPVQKLVITTIPSQIANTGFNITVSSTDNFGNVTNVTSDETVSLQVNTGTGVLPPTTMTIYNGTSSTTFTGVTYTVAENGVEIDALASGLTTGTSNAFNVLVQPSAAFNTSASHCGANTISVLLTSPSVATSPPYSLSYSIGGIAQTPVSFSSFPYSLPAGTGTYQLTGFSYTNGNTYNGVASSNSFQIWDLPTTAVADTVSPGSSISSSVGVSNITNLLANHPNTGTGLWTIKSGDGNGSFTTPTIGTSGFSGTLGTTYKLLWTIINGVCSTKDSITVSLPPTTYYLSGNDPSIPSNWYSNPQGTFGWSLANFTATNLLYIVPSTAAVAMTGDWSVTEVSSTLEVDGTLDAGTHTLAFDNYTGNGTYKFGGNINGVAVPTGTVVYYGDQNIAPGAYNNLTINGSVAGPGTPTIYITGPTTVSGTLTLAQGVVFADNATNTLTLLNTATISGGSNTCYIDGSLTQTVASSSSTTLIFPVGASDGMHEIDITVQQTDATSTTYAGSYSSYSDGASQPAWTLPSGMVGVSQKGFWHISKSHESIQSDGTDANLVSATMTLHFDETNDGVTDPSTLVVAKSNTISSQWINVGNNSYNGTSVTSGAFYAFCDITLGTTSSANALPIELTSFNASVNTYNESINLTWITATETNNNLFAVERSTDGVNWTVVYTCQGAGTSSKEHSYQFIDNGISKNTDYYYRLKQTDINGASTYSNIVSVETQNSVYGCSVYPIPSKGVINITLSGNVDQFVSMAIITPTGDKVFSADTYQSTVNLTDLPDGIYYLKMIVGGDVILKPIVTHK